MLAHVKIVVSGRSIEVLRSKIPVLYGYKTPGRKRIRQTDPDKIKETRTKTIAQAARKIRRIIDKNDYYWSRKFGENYNPAFVTLTFRENLQDLDVANHEFTLFMQRLNHRLRYSGLSRLKYVGAIEFQERGAIHYHMIIFNLPYLPKLYDELRSLWKLGSINHKSIKKVNGLSKYVTKYIKKHIDDIRLIGRKSYFTSRGLEKSRTYRDPEQSAWIMLFLEEKYKVFETTLGDKYLGEVEYLKYEYPYDDSILQKIN